MGMVGIPTVASLAPPPQTRAVVQGRSGGRGGGLQPGVDGVVGKQGVIPVDETIWESFGTEALGVLR